MAEHDFLEQALRIAPREEFRLRLRTELAAAASKSVEEKMTVTEQTYLREGMRSLNPYIVTVDARRLVDAIVQVFGGREKLRVPRPDGSIMHAEIEVGDTTIELADGIEKYPARPMALHVFVPDVDAAHERALAAGLEVLYPPTDQPYGARDFAARDHNANHWYISTAKGPSYIPEGLRTVNFFLHPKGTLEFIDFIERAFGAERVELHQDGEGRVVHGRCRIGDTIFEMSEHREQWPEMPANIHHYVPDVDAAYRRALEAGATSQREPVDEPYGDRAAGVVDAWGNNWWLAAHMPKPV